MPFVALLCAVIFYGTVLRVYYDVNEGLDMLEVRFFGVLGLHCAHRLGGGG